MIAASGSRSDEIDIAICNQDQPFLTGDHQQMLLVEGVGAVVQVKARLSSTEIERAVANAARVKALVRSAREGDTAFGKAEDMPHFLDRVPYVVFAFETELGPNTVVERLRDASGESTSQIDALFVLDRGAVWNLRENQGTIRVIGDYEGFHWIELGDETLVHFMRTLAAIVIRVRRYQSPLLSY